MQRGMREKMEKKKKSINDEDLQMAMVTVRAAI